MPMGTGPLRVAVMNDYEVVVAGLHQMLLPYSDRVLVVELDTRVPVVSDVDVLLYDAFSRERVTGPVEQVVAGSDASVVLYTWHLNAEIVRECLDKGVRGCVSKTLEAHELVEALEKVAGGSIVISPDPGTDAEPVAGNWPGRDLGLSARESEVIALIAQGLSNQEIADRAYLSINSVKTYIRSAYRKMGVQRRTQAVLWATEHGIRPRSARYLPEH
jgi:two-component system, NarL family, response regulator LiaR